MNELERATPPAEQVGYASDRRSVTELTALRCALGDRWESVLARLTPDDFRYEPYRVAFGFVAEAADEQGSPTFRAVRDRYVARAPEGCTPGLVDWSALAQPVDHQGAVDATVEEMLDWRVRGLVWEAMERARRDVFDLSLPGVDVRDRLSADLDDPDHVDHRLPLLSAAELVALPEPGWVVEGLMPQGQTTVFGAPGSGKTWVAMSIADAVARGGEWFGREVQEGPVIYLAGEGVGAVQNRTRWRGDPPVNLTFVPASVPLADRGVTYSMLRLVRRLRPVLIVVDTWQRYAALDDENAIGEQGAAWAVLDRLRDDYGVSSLVVHHANAEGNIRGRGLPEANADATLFVHKEHPDDDRFHVEPRKTRHGRGFEPLTFGWGDGPNGGAVVEMVGRSGRLLSDEACGEAFAAVRRAGRMDAAAVVAGFGPAALARLRTSPDFDVSGGVVTRVGPGL